MRPYLLLNGTDVLGVEVFDVADAQRLDECSRIVDTFVFSPFEL